MRLTKMVKHTRRGVSEDLIQRLYKRFLTQAPFPRRHEENLRKNYALALMFMDAVRQTGSAQGAKWWLERRLGKVERRLSDLHFAPLSEKGTPGIRQQLALEAEKTKLEQALEAIAKVKRW